MPIDYEALLLELKGIIAATWPAVVKADNGRKIYEVEHVTYIPFEVLTLEQGLPYAILVMPPLEPAEWAADTRTYEADVSLYLAVETAQGAGELRGLLETLCVALWETDLEHAQVIVEPYPEWGMSLEINQILRGKKLPVLAGRVVAPLLLCDPS